MIDIDIIEENMRVVLDGMLSQVVQLIELSNYNDSFNDTELEAFIILYERLRERYNGSVKKD